MLRLFYRGDELLVCVLLFKGGSLMFWRFFTRILVDLLVNLIVELAVAAILA